MAARQTRQGRRNSMDVREYYQHALAERGFSADQAQHAAVERLQRCYEEWVDYKAQRASVFKRLISRPAVPRGVYMWGGVGRGVPIGGASPSSMPASVLGEMNPL